MLTRKPVYWWSRHCVAHSRKNDFQWKFDAETTTQGSTVTKTEMNDYAQYEEKTMEVVVIDVSGLDAETESEVEWEPEVSSLAPEENEVEWEPEVSSLAPEENGGDDGGEHSTVQSEPRDQEQDQGQSEEHEQEPDQHENKNQQPEKDAELAEANQDVLAAADELLPQQRSATLNKAGAKPTQGSLQCSGCDKEESGSSVDASGLLPPLLTIPHGQASIDALLEERVLQIVLQHAPRFAMADDKRGVWDMIAAESLGRYETGEQARRRTAWLCKVLKNPHHYEFKKITPALREMLVEFLKLEPSPHLPLRKTPRLLQSVDRQWTGETRITKKASHKTTPTTNKSTPVVKSRTVVHAAKDELLMQLVLEKRVFAMSWTRKAIAWSEIVKAVQHPSAGCSMSGGQRVHALVRAFQNPTHCEHAKFTVRLREQLAAYIEQSSAFKNMKNQSRAPSARDSRACGEISEDEEISEGEEISKGEEICSKSRGEVPQPLSHRERDVLLCELLRARPFHARQGRVFDVWDRVAFAVRRRIRKRTSLMTGKACVVQMKRLLFAARHPNRSSSPQLSSRLVEMVRLLDTLIKTRWPAVEAKETDRHRRLRQQVERLLGPTRQRTHKVWVPKANPRRT